MATENDVIDDVIEPQETPVETPETPETPEVPKVDLEAQMAKLAEHVTKVTAPKESAPKELSQDEKDELWAVYNPTKNDPDFFRKFLRLKTDMEPAEIEAAVKEFAPIFASMQEGLIRQALKGAVNYDTIANEKLMERLAPLEEYISTERAEKTRGRFYKDFPALKDDKYSKAVDSTARLLDKQEFKDEDEYFKALAEGAADLIKGFVPDFDLGAGKQKKTTTTTPRLPRTTQGGGGGAGKGAAAGTAATGDQAGSVLD